MHFVNAWWMSIRPEVSICAEFPPVSTKTVKFFCRKEDLTSKYLNNWLTWQYSES